MYSCVINGKRLLLLMRGNKVNFASFIFLMASLKCSKNLRFLSIVIPRYLIVFDQLTGVFSILILASWVVASEKRMALVLIGLIDILNSRHHRSAMWICTWSFLIAKLCMLYRRRCHPRTERFWCFQLLRYH